MYFYEYYYSDFLIWLISMGYQFWMAKIEVILCVIICSANSQIVEIINSRWFITSIVKHILLIYSNKEYKWHTIKRVLDRREKKIQGISNVRKTRSIWKYLNKPEHILARARNRIVVVLKNRKVRKTRNPIECHQVI